MRVAVIGAGSWGTTMAAQCAINGPTILWARRPEVAKEISDDRTNRAYLPDLDLPRGLEATSDLKEAAERADVLVMAVPSHLPNQHKLISYFLSNVQTHFGNVVDLGD